MVLHVSFQAVRAGSQALVKLCRLSGPGSILRGTAQLQQQQPLTVAPLQLRMLPLCLCQLRLQPPDQGCIRYLHCPIHVSHFCLRLRHGLPQRQRLPEATANRGCMNIWADAKRWHPHTAALLHRSWQPRPLGHSQRLSRRSPCLRPRSARWQHSEQVGSCILSNLPLACAATSSGGVPPCGCPPAPPAAPCA